MSSVSRATRSPAAVYRAVEAAGKGRSKPERPSAVTRSAPGPDLANKLRAFHRTRGRVNERDALLDMVRAVNTTLDPARVAELIVERAATWIPAPCWALIAADVSGQPLVLADRELADEMGSAV